MNDPKIEYISPENGDGIQPIRIMSKQDFHTEFGFETDEDPDAESDYRDVPHKSGNVFSEDE